MLMPSKPKREVIFDRNALRFEVYQAMLAGISLSNVSHRSKLSVLLCGTGAGVFTMFLRHHFGQSLARLVTVDIS